MGNGTVRFGRVPGVHCTAPAVRVVEGYNPKDGIAHGSLDVVVYVCEEHHAAARDMWVQAVGAASSWTRSQPPITPHLCGALVDYRDTTSSADEAPETQDVGELGLLDPMPYRLTIDGEFVVRGTLQEIGAVVAERITGLLEKDPEGFALDAQTVNLAFNSGAVEQQLTEQGIWYTIFGVHTSAPLRIRITRE